MTRSSIVMMTTGLALIGGLTACGRVDPKDKPDQARPPAQLKLSAVISDRGVHLSTAKIGGGPVQIMISNQSPKAVRAQLVSAGGSSTATRKPIAPDGVAGINTDLKRGVYRLKAGDGTVATLTVGAQRPSSDGDLMEP